MKAIFTYEKNPSPIVIGSSLTDDKGLKYQVLKIQTFNHEVQTVSKLAYGDSMRLLDLQKNKIFYYDNTDFKNGTGSN